jgi:hypothetical protein
VTHAGSAVRLVLAELGPSPGAGPSVAMVAAARSLRDAGAEVVHGGVLASVRAVVRIVEQEDPAALVLGVVAETSETSEITEVSEATGVALWDPATVAELVAALPQVPLFGLGERACGAGLPPLPDELEDLVGSLAHAGTT